VLDEAAGTKGPRGVGRTVCNMPMKIEELWITLQVADIDRVCRGCEHPEDRMEVKSEPKELTLWDLGAEVA